METFKPTQYGLYEKRVFPFVISQRVSLEATFDRVLCPIRWLKIIETLVYPTTTMQSLKISTEAKKMDSEHAEQFSNSVYNHIILKKLYIDPTGTMA